MNVTINNEVFRSLRAEDQQTVKDYLAMKGLDWKGVSLITFTEDAVKVSGYKRNRDGYAKWWDKDFAHDPVFESMVVGWRRLPRKETA